MKLHELSESNDNFDDEMNKAFHGVKDANPDMPANELWDSKEMKALRAKHGEQKIQAAFDEWLAGY